MNNLTKHLRSYRAAFSGFKIGTLTELNFQIEVVLGILVIIAGIIFPITKEEWIIIILCIGITLSAELMNTSIEVLGELKRFNKVIKKIKDLAAAAVLTVAIMDIILGIMIFLPYIKETLESYF